MNLEAHLFISPRTSGYYISILIHTWFAKDSSDANFFDVFALDPNGGGVVASWLCYLVGELTYQEPR